MAVHRREVLIGGGAAGLAMAGATLAGLHGMGSMAEYDAVVGASRRALGKHPGLRDILRFATLAPNGHNTQPWRFRVASDRIEMAPDFMWRTPVVDPDDHHIFVSLGCAAENLCLAAAAGGYVADMVWTGRTDGSIAFPIRSGTPRDSTLFQAIAHRQSTRGPYEAKPMQVSELSLLASAARTTGVDLVLITQREGIDQVRDLVVAGNTAQMNDRAFRRELLHWLRFNARDAIRAGDGMFSAGSGAAAVPTWAGPFLFEQFITAQSENKRYASYLDSSSGVAIFVGAHADPRHWVQVGRACQRFALQATALGLKCAFINQPVEVASLRPELASLIGAKGYRPDIVMRFGRGPALPFSARRATATLLA